MKVDKKIYSQIYRDYLFLTGKINIDSKYFISKIEEGLKESSLHFKTNVMGYMTPFNYFNRDEQFLKILYVLFEEIETFPKVDAFEFNDCWGIRESFSNYTKPHEHKASSLSGLIYLNDHTQPLKFPQIDQEIKPEKGRFVIFSGFLTHSSPRNLSRKSKYALVFNLNHRGFNES